uniref:CBM21 domain-containing protein n=1 Tax=Strigamia maritima TaxID=126957 RepID=T1ISP1_STRMM
MPVDCEIYFGVNPPAFRQNSYRNHLTGLSFNNMRNKLNAKKMPLSFPLRPILIMRPDHEANTEDGATSPTSKLKKRVIFADEKGNPLTEIKFMSEPSNYPPQWDDDFMLQVTKGASAAPAVSISSDKWETAFAQPVSDYVEFRTKLEKIANLAFNKIVFLRVTFDSWKSHEDIDASHVASLTAGTSVYELFDTFSFSFNIPERPVVGQNIEFCVCFKCSGCEYWDSNNGENYKIILIPGKSEVKTDANMNVLRFEDALKAKMDNWTEFASWQHLVFDLFIRRSLERCPNGKSFALHDLFCHVKFTCYHMQVIKLIGLLTVFLIDSRYKFMSYGLVVLSSSLLGVSLD